MTGCAVLRRSPHSPTVALATMVRELTRLLTPQEGQLPSLKQSDIERLGILQCRINGSTVTADQTRQLWAAIEQTLLLLQVGRVHLLVTQFGPSVGLNGEWPQCIAAPAVDAIGRAHHAEQPHIALTLARTFVCYTDMWDQFTASMNAQGLVLPAVQIDCPIDEAA